MTYQEIIEKIKSDLERAVEFLKEELLKIRTSRLYPSLIEDIEVEISGTKMPLKSWGAISSPSFRELVIQPWDKSYIEPITKAIEKSGFDLTIISDKEAIRLTAPPLTGERREDLLRLLGQSIEDTHQVIRRIRDRAWKEMQAGFQKGELREDDKYKGKDKLEEAVGKYMDGIEELAERKRKEIIG